MNAALVSFFLSLRHFFEWSLKTSPQHILTFSLESMGVSQKGKYPDLFFLLLLLIFCDWIVYPQWGGSSAH